MGDAPPQSILQFVSDWAVGKGVFKRSKVPMDKKILGVFLSYSGFTYREAAKLVGGISYVAVHDACKSFQITLPKLLPTSRTVSIEENVVNLNSERKGILWLARDVDAGDILSMRCSMEGSEEDRKRFIDSVLAVCTGRPLLRIGRGPSFPHNLSNLDYYFQIDTTPSIRQRLGKWIMGDTPVSGQSL